MNAKIELIIPDNEIQSIGLAKGEDCFTLRIKGGSSVVLDLKTLKRVMAIVEVHEQVSQR